MTRSRVQWGLTIVPVVLLCVMAWQHHWMSDDGFIHLRVVEQITHGHGPVINQGERVEASTSPLWVWLLAAFDLAGGPALAWKAVVLGIVGAGLGLLLAQRSGIALARAAGDLRTVLPIGAVVVAVFRPFWDYATSGLETGLIFGWLGGAQWWCARRATATEDRPVRWGSDLLGAAVVGLGALIHPDLAIFTLAFGAVLVAAAWQDGRRRAIAVVAAMAAPPVLYEIFRMGYYGMLVPNSALAKEAGHPQWGKGWNYLVDLVVPYWLWLPVAGLVALLAAAAWADWRGGGRLRAACRLAPVAAALVQTVYIVRVGGDFMHARLLLPALFAIVAPVGLPVSVRDLRVLRTPRVAGTAAAAVVAVWALVAVVALPTAGAVPHQPNGTIENERHVWRGAVRLDEVPSAYHAPVAGRVIAMDQRLSLVSVPLRRGVPAAGASVPAGGMGEAYAWHLDVDVLELASLTHPVGSHLFELVGPRIGHQKPLTPVWQLAGLVPDQTVRDLQGRVVVTAADLRAADRARSCGALGTYLDGIDRPLTLGRFLRNIEHSFANTRLRVPTDPQAAERQFCG